MNKFFLIIFFLLLNACHAPKTDPGSAPLKHTDPSSKTNLEPPNNDQPKKNQPVATGVPRESDKKVEQPPSNNLEQFFADADLQLLTKAKDELEGRIVKLKKDHAALINKALAQNEDALLTAAEKEKFTEIVFQFLELRILQDDGQKANTAAIQLIEKGDRDVLKKLIERMTAKSSQISKELSEALPKPETKEASIKLNNLLLDYASLQGKIKANLMFAASSLNIDLPFLN